MMSKAKIPLHPKHPERTCWGCDKYCSADDLRCANGTVRTQHPVELFGEDWLEWELARSVTETRSLSENGASTLSSEDVEGTKQPE